MNKMVKIKCWNCGKVFEVINSNKSRKFCPNSNCYNEFKDTVEYKQYLKDKLKRGNQLWRKNTTI